jgi:hypothetical protein
MHRIDDRGGVRRVRDVVCGVCTVWLVVQNVVLATMIAWGIHVSVFAGGASVARAALHVAGVAWALSVTAALVVVFWLLLRASRGQGRAGRV